MEESRLLFSQISSLTIEIGDKRQVINQGVEINVLDT